MARVDLETVETPMPARIRPGPLRATWLMLALAGLWLPAHAAAEGDDTKGPVETDLVEETGISLTLLDVQVTDKKGRPIRGLTKDDFKVRLNGRKREIYSLDDLCDCPETPAAAPIPDAGAEASPEAERSEIESSADSAPSATGVTPVRFVLYFDFSQLQLDGRARAVGEAKRWIRETLRPDDQVMVAAYATAAGLRELADFTGDKEALVAAVDEAYETFELIDPFPFQIDDRRGQCFACCREVCPVLSSGMTCADCCPICVENASDEYFHGRRSMKALRAFLIDLQDRPGRKALLFFHQNGTLFPASLYPVPEGRVGDHLSMLDEVSAEAALARTVVYPAYSGDASGLEEPVAGQAVNLGANLADLTGGRHNRGPADLAVLTNEAGRGCACTYRIGLVPPDRSAGRLYRVSVKATKRAVTRRGRVRFLSELDRWLRKAEAALARPENFKELDVSAAVVPVRVTKEGWDAEVQIAVDLEAFVLLPTADELEGNWEVGALLTRDDGAQDWEMLGVSTLTSKEATRTGKAVLHGRSFERLKAGSYRLGAFVRDRTANVYGGADAFIDLPKPERGTLVGPVVLRAARERLVAPLPLWNEDAGEAVRVDTLEVGPLPGGEGSGEVGDALAMLTFVCSDGKAPRPESLMRYVSRDGTPLFRFPAAVPEAAGLCFRVSDVVETWRLNEGDYRYHIRWKDQRRTTASEASFRVRGDIAGSEGRAEAADDDSAAPLP